MLRHGRCDFADAAEKKSQKVITRLLPGRAVSCTGPPGATCTKLHLSPNLHVPVAAQNLQTVLFTLNRRQSSN